MAQRKGKALKVLWVFRETTNYASRPGALPCEWPKRSCELELKQTWKIVEIIRRWLLTTRALFMLYQSYCYFQAEDDVPLFERILVFYYTFAICTVACNTGVVHSDPRAMQVLVNNLIRISQRFYDDETDSSAARVGNSKSVILCLHLLKFTCTFVSTMYSIRILWKPWNFRYLTSLLSNPESASSAIGISAGIFHTAAMGFEFFVFMFTFSFAMVFTCITVDMMRRLRLEVSTAMGRVETATLHRIHKYSLEMAVLLQQFNYIYGTYMLFMEMVGILASVVNITLAIVHASPRSLAVGSAVFLLSINAYKTFGVLYEESKVTHKSWTMRGRRGPAWFSRFCKAQRPARIVIGSFFHADRSLKLTMLSTILDATVNLVLTTHGN